MPLFLGMRLAEIALQANRWSGHTSQAMARNLSHSSALCPTKKLENLRGHYLPVFVWIYVIDMILMRSVLRWQKLGVSHPTHFLPVLNIRTFSRLEFGRWWSNRWNLLAQVCGLVFWGAANSIKSGHFSLKINPFSKKARWISGTHSKNSLKFQK